MYTLLLIFVMNGQPKAPLYLQDIPGYQTGASCEAVGLTIQEKYPLEEMPEGKSVLSLAGYECIPVFNYGKIR